ncbi:hypothetical protein HID58_016226 [Brassica napus]|uniref:DUF7903 domain-containing protein n=1 Tax=Brassica napus TaxID=3708 RepID=A0ABQ8DMB1_BRANA|nr:hypothetical protein HID58_016226 [Brassica napus]
MDRVKTSCLSMAVTFHEGLSYVKAFFVGQVRENIGKALRWKKGRILLLLPLRSSKLVASLDLSCGRVDMSYIPPHKRHSKDPNRPSPVPDSLVTKFKNNLDFKSSSDKINRVTFSENFISKWLLVSSNGIKDEFPASVDFVPFSSDSVECVNGERPLVLMNNDINKVSEQEERTQWLLIAEKVEEDLVLAYERAKTSVEENQHVLRLVARFGKILLYKRKPGPLAEFSQKNFKKMFSTNVPTSNLQHMMSNVEDGRLSMYKAELNVVWHMVVDMSCIDKSLDMRLMLAAKRKMTALTEKEISDIKGLLDSATVDPNVKGGLRWPLGKASSGDGYRIFEVCHVRATIYKNQTLSLRVRETDRFNERTGTGAVKREVTLILKDVNTKLQEQNIERGCVIEMLRDTLGTIWDFMHCDASSLT